MRRLIWGFAGGTYHIVGNLMLRLILKKYVYYSLQGKIGLNAARMVMELIRDNRKIVDRITHDHIDKFVDLLRRDKNYRYLDLLSVLCVCDGVSIADNQKYITEVWLMKGVKVQYVSTIDTRGMYH